MTAAVSASAGAPASRGATRSEPQSLDDRILEAELRLIARDESARRRLDTIGRKLKRLPRPRDLLWPVAGSAVGGIGLIWAWRRLVRGGRRHERPAPAPQPTAGAHFGAGGSFAGLPWVQLIGLAWPMVPARLRARVDPSLVSTFLAVGLPWLQAALARTPTATAQPSGGTRVQSVGALDLKRYAGTWYEIARLPAPFEAVCKGQPTATYTPLADGSIEVVNRCFTIGTHETASDGVAQVVPGSGGSKLKVSLFPEWLHWLPFAWADYWVLAVDTGYRRALVGEPKRRFLWVLSRSPHMSEGDLDELLAIAQQQGYDLAKLKINTPPP